MVWFNESRFTGRFQIFTNDKGRTWSGFSYMAYWGKVMRDKRPKDMSCRINNKNNISWPNTHSEFILGPKYLFSAGTYKLKVPGKLKYKILLPIKTQWMFLSKNCFWMDPECTLVLMCVCVCVSPSNQANYRRKDIVCLL